jgi:hypothetical protein
VGKDIGQCKYLTQDETTLISGCLLYDELKDKPDAMISPAFGAGCCRSMFNETRQTIIARDYDNRIPMIEIDDLSTAIFKMEKANR